MLCGNLIVGLLDNLLAEVLADRAFANHLCVLELLLAQLLKFGLLLLDNIVE
ncbi:MAG: hypothetical protein WDN10_00240 [bacterium]